MPLVSYDTLTRNVRIGELTTTRDILAFRDEQDLRVSLERAPTNCRGIRNDPNDWAIDHDDPTYILDLVGRVVTVSIRTLDIVEGLPSLDI